MILDIILWALANTEIHRLLAGSFALIMVVSMVFPAYAAHIDREAMEPGEAVTLTETSSGVMPSSDDDIIYQNGNNPVPFAGVFIDDKIIADDFVLSQDFVVTDAHFTAFLDPPPITVEPLLFFILEDDGGVPGNVISSGLAQNVELMELETDRFEVWFDFEEGVPLDGGVTYWFALKYTDTFAVISPEPRWEISDVVTGNSIMLSVSIPPTQWFPFTNFDVWFQLTGDGEVVGGELLPIDTTTLLLAGAQMNAAWMIPVIVSAIGIGIVIARKF